MKPAMQKVKKTDDLDRLVGSIDIYFETSDFSSAGNFYGLICNMSLAIHGDWDIVKERLDIRIKELIDIYKPKNIMEFWVWLENHKIDPTPFKGLIFTGEDLDDVLKDFKKKKKTKKNIDIIDPPIIDGPNFYTTDFDTED